MARGVPPGILSVYGVQQRECPGADESPIVKAIKVNTRLRLESCACAPHSALARSRSRELHCCTSLSLSCLCLTVSRREARRLGVGVPKLGGILLGQRIASRKLKNFASYCTVPKVESGGYNRPWGWAAGQRNASRKLKNFASVGIVNDKSLDTCTRCTVKIWNGIQLTEFCKLVPARPAHLASASLASR